jgi:hypothetical protein
LEDVTITNITMRDVTNSPLFLRLVKRLRGPAGSVAGRLRRVNLSNIIAYNADARYASIIAGLAERQVESVLLNNIRIYYRGGGQKKDPLDVPPPERETNYPEPSMFGEIPAYGFFIRHAKGNTLNNVAISYLTDELRPPFMLVDVNGIAFAHVTAQRAADVPAFVFRDVLDFTTRDFKGLPDTRLDRVGLGKL